MRKIELTLTDEFRDATAKLKGKEVEAAIGYLSAWAAHNDRYVNASIYGDHEGNLNASYRNKDGAITYSMFGLLTDGKYSFHS